MKIGVLSSVGHTLDSFFPPLVESWEALGVEVSLAAGTSATRFDNAVLPRLTRSPSIKNFGSIREIDGWAKRDSLDVILTNTATASALARIRKISVPVVYFCHGLHWNTGDSPSERLWMGIENFLLRNTHAVMCMNSDDFAWFGSRLPDARLHFLRNGVGVPQENYPAAAMPQGDTLRLLWAGEFSARKRPYLMIEIARQLHRNQVKFHLTMIGQGPLLDEVRALAAKHGLSHLVYFPGFSDFPSQMNASHILVHTALWEGLPRVMLEARVMQRQSIAFDVKGVRDIPDVVLVSNDDTEEFAAVLSRIGNQTMANRMLLPTPSPSIDSSNVAREIIGFLESVL